MARSKRRWTLWIVATAGLVAPSLIIASPAWASCNPGRTPTLYYSHYQGGLQATSVQLAGATIDYYTPYVVQGQGSTSSAWQALVSTQCLSGGISYPFAQAGFVQLPGDSHDSVFTETATCSGGIGPVLEFPSKPRVTSRFNVKNATGSGTADLYQGSNLLQSAFIDWSANQLWVFAEVHDQDDQGYGGTSAQKNFGAIQYEDRSGGFHDDSLKLTPNNHSSSNDSGLPTSAWLKVTVGSDAFSTYDSGCSS